MTEKEGNTNRRFAGQSC